MRYSCDRIESQILLLADTFFSIKDYETASSHYKLVKDDFKSDRSYMHYLHCNLMLAICHGLTDPNKPKDRSEYIEAIVQAVAQPQYVNLTYMYE